MIEFDSVDNAKAAHDSSAYQVTIAAPVGMLNVT